MSVILPNSINYKEGLPALPEGTQQINVSANPVQPVHKFILTCSIEGSCYRTPCI